MSRKLSRPGIYTGCRRPTEIVLSCCVSYEGNPNFAGSLIPLETYRRIHRSIHRIDTIINHKSILTFTIPKFFIKKNLLWI